MRRRLKVVIVAAARPNFMKVAPLIKAIRRRNGAATRREPDIVPILVHTGQHYDANMSGKFFEELGIPIPDVNLGVGSGSHAEQTAQVITKFEPVCLEYRPDCVVVVGDVNSTLACALTCAKLGIRVAHVEAGLRSYDRTMPEEINRVLTDAIADLLLTPSVDANDNLAREGIDASRIHLVGNVMIDSLLANLPRVDGCTLGQELGVAPRQFVYVTLHRPSNVDDPDTLAAIIAELERLGATVPVVFPMHPRTRKHCVQFGISLDGASALRVVEPLAHHESLYLVKNARVVLTDSGGLQEESTYFRTPCLTLRPNTERPITLTVGSNRLTDRDRLAVDLDEALRGPERRGQIPPFWDGRTAERIVETLLESAG